MKVIYHEYLIESVGSSDAKKVTDILRKVRKDYPNRPLNCDDKSVSWNDAISDIELTAKRFPITDFEYDEDKLEGSGPFLIIKFGSGRYSNTQEYELGR